MPNWCVNKLSITGPARHIAALKKVGIDFEHVLPYPKRFLDQDELAQRAREEYQAFVERQKNAPPGEEARAEAVIMGLAIRNWNDLPRDGFNSGGYEWCVNNWGTKWPPSDLVLLKNSPTHLLYQFETAWSPPVPVVEAYSKKYPELTFKLRYYEAGMGYQGRLTVKAGNVSDQWNGDYRGTLGG